MNDTLSLRYWIGVLISCADAGGETADGFEPVARGHAFFGGLALGDVEAGADDAGQVAVASYSGIFDVTMTRLVPESLSTASSSQSMSGLPDWSSACSSAKKFLRHLARIEIEVGLADGLFGRDAHAMATSLLQAGETAVGVLRRR
jgi:hypothetical protein